MQSLIGMGLSKCIFTDSCCSCCCVMHVINMNCVANKFAQYKINAHIHAQLLCTNCMYVLNIEFVVMYNVILFVFCKAVVAVGCCVAVRVGERQQFIKLSASNLMGNHDTAPNTTMHIVRQLV